MKKIFLSLLFIFIFLSSFLFLPKGYTDELEDLTKQISDLTTALNQSINATKPLESQLNSLQTQISGIKFRIGAIEQDIEQKKEDIDKGYKNLAKQQEILNVTIRDFYIKSYYNSPLLLLLSADSASEFTQILGYQKANADRDKAIITNMAVSISSLEDRKKALESEQLRLATIKSDLDKQSAKLDEIVSGAKAYQNNLSGQIAQLTAKQQSILSEKSGTFVTAVGDVPLADDPKASPNYNPGFSPAFAAFSFGAYTHRKGMSQYGAKGRAQSGQNSTQILHAYYGKDPVSKDTGGTIKVSGYGEIDFEGRYLMGIAEMPSSFPKEALKAQAIAARSYAYRYKSQGTEICTNEACQVYLNSKADNPPSEWRQAVEETRGQIIEDVVTYYSSTTGGYSTTGGWDTTSGTKDTWTSGAYEKIGNSPWFYKAWYTQSYSISSSTCGEANPWLNQEEMADILNSYLIQNKSGVDNGRITPVTTSCWGGNPYSMGDVRNLAGSVGGGSVTSVSSVSVTYSNDGTTANVSFGTNRGTISLSGSDFKQIFNLRAPGYISIKSPLFNIEKK
jgi:peptidoglycan hydrolase-like amidase